MQILRADGALEGKRELNFCFLEALEKEMFGRVIICFFLGGVLQIFVAFLLIIWLFLLFCAVYWGVSVVFCLLKQTQDCESALWIDLEYCFGCLFVFVGHLLVPRNIFENLEKALLYYLL